MYHANVYKPIQNSHTDDETFVRGRASAGMITRLIYNVNVKLDCHGVVDKIQCECALEMGPGA